MAKGTSATRATVKGLPLSNVSSCANSSRCVSRRSANFQMSLPRSEVVIRRHGPWSNAARAACTALSISAFSPSATCARTSPVAGLNVEKVLPDAASTHWPSMSSLRGLAIKSLTRSSIRSSEVAIVMINPPDQLVDGDRVECMYFPLWTVAGKDTGYCEGVGYYGSMFRCTSRARSTYC